PAFAGEEVEVTTVFPSSLPEWPAHWDAEAGTLRIESPAEEAGARVFRIRTVRIDGAEAPAPRTGDV
ncbi:hypothetical protein SB782_38280, partial [Brevibacillus sp. SIMBA_076]